MKQAHNFAHVGTDKENSGHSHARCEMKSLFIKLFYNFAVSG